MSTLTEDQIIELLGILSCPITNEPMIDPVLAPDGYTYERKAIETWLLTKNTSPMTREKIDASDLTSKREIKQVTQILKSILESGDLVMNEEDEEENDEKTQRVAEKNKHIGALIAAGSEQLTDRISQSFVQKYNEFKDLVLVQTPQSAGFFPVNILMVFFAYSGKHGVRLDNLVTYLDGKPVSNTSQLYIHLLNKDEDIMQKLQNNVEEIKHNSVPLGTVSEFIARTQQTNANHGIRDINGALVYDPYNHVWTPNVISGNYNVKSTLKRSDDPTVVSYIAWSPSPYVEKKAKTVGGGRRRTRRRYKKTKGKRHKSKRRNHKTKRTRR